MVATYSALVVGIHATVSRGPLAASAKTARFLLRALEYPFPLLFCRHIVSVRRVQGKIRESTVNGSTSSLHRHMAKEGYVERAARLDSPSWNPITEKKRSSIDAWHQQQHPFSTSRVYKELKVSPHHE